MKPSSVFQIHKEEIRRVIARHPFSNARVFGSVLHNCDTENSDLDILVDPEASVSLFDLSGLQLDLTELLGVRVSIVTPNALPQSFREIVLTEAQPI